jgi:hypothetical protein
MLDDLYRVLSDRDALPSSVRRASRQVSERIELIRNELVTSITSPALAGRAEALRRLSGNDGGNVVTILGDRGVGKTTTLYGVISDYEHDAASSVAGDIVLPVVRPGHFAEHDSIFSWCLYFLADFAGAGHLDREGVERGELQSDITDLQRLHALRELDHITWASADVVPERAAARVATLSALQPEVSAGWQRLVSRVTQAHDGRHPLIIVPVDDLDVGGMKVRELLEELHQLAVHPAVIVVACLHRLDVEMALTRHEIDRMPAHLSDSEGVRQRLVAERSAYRGMTKLMPAHLRVELLPMSQEEALQFQPMHATHSLAGLLQRVPVAALGPERSLLDLFVVTMGDRHMHTPFATILPRLARDLEQVHAGISILIESGKATPRSVMELLTRLALGSIVSTVGTHLRDRLPSLPSTPDERWQIDLSNFTIVTFVAGGASRPLPDKGKVGFRSIKGYPVYFHGEDDRSNSALPEQMEGLVQLLIESTNQDSLSDELLSATRVGRVAFPGGRNSSSHIDVTLNGERTDNEFLVIPEWEGAYDYYLHRIGWDVMVERIGARTTSTGIDDVASELAYLIAGNIGLVASIASTRSLPAWLTDDAVDIQGLDDLDSPASLAWFEEIEILLRDTFVDAYQNTADNQRNRDYVVWVVDQLLWATDEVFAPGHVASWLRKVRENAIAAAPGLDPTAAARSASGALVRRIQESLNSGWVTSLLELLQTVDQDASERMRRLHLYNEGGLQEERQAMIAQLRKTTFPAPLIDIIEISGVTDEMRQRLRMFFPAESVEQIAALFPASIGLDETLRTQAAAPIVVDE